MTNSEKFPLLDSAAMNEMLVGSEVVGWGSGMDELYINDGNGEMVVKNDNHEIAGITWIDLCDKITSVRVEEEGSDGWQFEEPSYATISVYVTTETSIQEKRLFLVRVYDGYDNKNVFFTKEIFVEG